MEQVKGNYIKSLKIVHNALLIGQFLFLAVSIFIVAKNSPVVSSSLDKTLQVAALVISFAAVFASANIFKNRLAAISSITEVTDKGNQYRAANIIKWSLIEGPAIFVIICFFITGNYSFAALALALIIYFFLSGPSKIKMMLQTQLSEQEIDDL